MDNLDIVNASFSSPNATTVWVTLAIRNLTPPPPPANLPSAYWTVFWTYNGTEYYAQATSNGGGPAGLFFFSDGTYSKGNFNPNAGITGTANTGAYTGGPAGTLVMDVPLSDVGSPPSGAQLTNTFADTHGALTVTGAGLYYTAEADRGPNLAYGAPWSIGKHC